ncbi:septum site-determining protein MinC [Acidihalobacter prosperus]
MQKNTPACELKGSRFTLSVVNLYSTDLEAIDMQLSALLAQAPGFLDMAPVVIEPGTLEDPEMLDLVALSRLLRQHKLIPAALRTNHETLRLNATKSGLAILPFAPSSSDQKQRSTQNSERPANANPQPLTVSRPVRSGQQIYAENTDLVIFGAVSAGAEIIADGNIHIYGALRGRALAGARGNESARIFYQSLDAEILSIAGCYRVLEDRHLDTMRGKQGYAWLEGERLMIDTL